MTFNPAAPTDSADPTTRPVTATARGFMIDSARCQENRSYYRRFIEFAAQRGTTVLLWHFTDDQGCSMQFDSVPGIASPHAYSKAELRELIQFARGHGIEMVPELASLGHCRYLTRLPAYQHLNEGDSHFTGMSPVSPETRDVIKKLIVEVADVFDSDDFHVGLDEVNIGQHPLTKAAMQTQTRGALLADYVLYIHGIVTGLGRRMWMWGDGLLKHPEMLERVPRDTVICNWQYTPHASSVTTQKLLDGGFDVMLCSAMISYDQPLFPGERFSMPNIRTLQSQQSLVGHGKVLGHLTTIWTPVRYLADAMWPAIDLAAAIQREGAAVDSAGESNRFGRDFFGFNETAAAHFTEVAQRLFADSPMRDEWVHVTKLQPLLPEMRDHVTKLAPRWAAAHQLLLNLAPSVGAHAVEFTTFSLMIEMLATTYEMAARPCGRKLSPTALDGLIDRYAELIDRVDKNWDRERFADDSRKYTAPIASFQNDHLISLLNTGLAALRTKRAAARAKEPLSIVSEV